MIARMTVAPTQKPFESRRASNTGEVALGAGLADVADLADFTWPVDFSGVVELSGVELVTLMALALTAVGGRAE